MRHARVLTAARRGALEPYRRAFGSRPCLLVVVPVEEAARAHSVAVDGNDDRRLLVDVLASPDIEGEVGAALAEQERDGTP